MPDVLFGKGDFVFAGIGDNPGRRKKIDRKNRLRKMTAGDILLFV